MASAVTDIKLTLMVGSTRSMAAHCRGVRLLASSRVTCSWRDTGPSQTHEHKSHLHAWNYTMFLQKTSRIYS